MRTASVPLKEASNRFIEANVTLHHGQLLNYPVKGYLMSAAEIEIRKELLRLSSKIDGHNQSLLSLALVLVPNRVSLL